MSLWSKPHPKECKIRSSYLRKKICLHINTNAITLTTAICLILDVAERLRDVTVTVGMTESDVTTPCGVFAGPGTLSQVVDISCPNTLPMGRFVKISKTTDFLTLCEVEVFGYPDQWSSLLKSLLKLYRRSVFLFPTK